MFTKMVKTMDPNKDNPIIHSVCSRSRVRAHNHQNHATTTHILRRGTSIINKILQGLYFSCSLAIWFAFACLLFSSFSRACFCSSSVAIYALMLSILPPSTGSFNSSYCGIFLHYLIYTTFQFLAIPNIM